MTESTANLAAKLEERFSNELLNVCTDRDEVTLELAAEDFCRYAKCCETMNNLLLRNFLMCAASTIQPMGKSIGLLRESTSTGFSRGRQVNASSQLSSNDLKRYAVVYHLLSITHNIRLRLRCYVSDEYPRIASVYRYLEFSRLV